MKIKNITFIIILVSFFITQLSFGSENKSAQTDNPENIIIAQTDDSDTNFKQRDDAPRRKGKKHKRFEKFRQRKLLELLELSDNQKDKLLPLMEKIRYDGHELIIDKTALTEKLTIELKQNKPDDLKINDYIDKIIKLSEKHEQLKNKLLLEVKQFLTPVQLGKMIIFEERFHKRAMENLFGERRRVWFGPDSDSSRHGNK